MRPTDYGWGDCSKCQHYNQSTLCRNCIYGNKEDEFEPKKDEEWNPMSKEGLKYNSICSRCGHIEDVTEFIKKVKQEIIFDFLKETRIKAPISVEWYIIKLIDGLKEDEKKCFVEGCEEETIWHEKKYHLCRNHARHPELHIPEFMEGEDTK